MKKKVRVSRTGARSLILQVQRYEKFMTHTSKTAVISFTFKRLRQDAQRCVENHKRAFRNYTTTPRRGNALLAQGIALGTRKLMFSPCKGKSPNMKQCFCPFRAKLPTSIYLGRCPRLCAFAPSGRYRLIAYNYSLLIFYVFYLNVLP